MHVGVWACEGVLLSAVSPWALLRIGPANTVRDSPIVGSISRLEPLAIPVPPLDFPQRRPAGSVDP